ncbi:MAG: hypothetical protein K6E90_07975, partial [Lachnospiraceae bacterium]|nr:hypothetical protein [Lachnospiraceae bacterium]
MLPLHHAPMCEQKKLYRIDLTMSRRKSKILSMKHIEMYTDGACSGNPGPGGWGTILVFRGMEKEMSGFVPGTTNNRMEIFAVIQGLRALK